MEVDALDLSACPGYPTDPHPVYAHLRGLASLPLTFKAVG